MKKIFAILAALLGLPVVVAAQVPQCGASLMPAFTAQQAINICSKWGSLVPFTVDGADNQTLTLGYPGESRGGSIEITGNESGTIGRVTVKGGSTAGGIVRLQSTAASGGGIDISSGNSGTQTWFFEGSGRLRGDATNGGDIVFQRSGATLSLQEATPSTACMGVSTPTGNTPVTVTTSCAVSGARVFFSRVGAITNMGTITATTAPNGTSFAFASTGASDTTASSVIWLIVKESA